MNYSVFRQISLHSLEVGSHQGCCGTHGASGWGLSPKSRGVESEPGCGAGAVRNASELGPRPASHDDHSGLVRSACLPSENTADCRLYDNPADTGFGTSRTQRGGRIVATNDQLKALVKSHADGDDPQFYSVAMQVAAKAARAGQEKFAQEMRDLVDELRKSSAATSRIASVVPVSQPRGELASLLSVSYPDARVADLVLPGDVSDGLKHVLLEQRQRDVLARHGLTPARRVLLIGPPGTGKTSTARVIAGELGLPLFAIRLDTIITKFMGETAAKLRLIFDALVETRGVYLFDEIDALAGDRTAGNDVGEIRRVLNSFLQFLEEDTSESLIVAATNHPQLLDSALFRRFDTVMSFPLPNDEVVREVIRNRLSGFRKSNLSWKRVFEAARGLSHAEISVASENAAKRTVLSGRSQILTNDLVSALEERPRPNSQRDKTS
jgi:SpoVK/Ycf46/Vps4 family AAA+-type ATPase